MQQLEPTYLRYVYDGLSKGSISSNNPTSLPIGFIGLFEDEFPSSMPLVERMSILNRLATWALLKGPVSIEMVAEVLNEHPDKTKALIDNYSKWFNSPEPGKYVLYHDRLRTYLLQKLSDHEVQDLNETLISYLEKALSDEKGDESELYALEHLSTHMLVESQLENNYQRLHEYVNKDVLWPRQINVSKEYKWSQKGIQQSIKEAARRNDDKIALKSAISQIEIIEKEESSYNEILDLIQQDELDFCLQRVFSWKAQSKFKICILVLSETLYGRFGKKDIDKGFFIQLTDELKALLSDDKNVKTNKKETGEQKILLIDWKKFIPQIVIYHIHLALDNKQIDFSFIWQNHESLDFTDIINFDYGDLREKNRWLIPIANVCYDNSYLYNLDNFIELAKFTLRNNYEASFKEYLRCINILLDTMDKKQKHYYEKYIQVFRELFYNDSIKSFDNKEMEYESFNKIIESLYLVEDFHLEKEIYSILSSTFKNTPHSSVISDRIIDLFHSKSYSDDYQLRVKHEFSELLYEINSFEDALNLIIKTDIYSYEIYIKLLKSNIASNLKSEILNKINYGLESENEYEIRMHSSSEKYLRSELLIQLHHYHIETSNPKLALISINKIDMTKEYGFPTKFFTYYSEIGRLLFNLSSENYSFDFLKLRSSFLNDNKYVNCVITEKELKSLFISKNKSFEYLDTIDNISISHNDINKGIQQFFHNILFEDGQFICGYKGGFIDNLISNNYFDIAFDLISLIPLESDYWRNNYLLEVGCFMLNQNRFFDLKMVLKKIDSEIFKFQLLAVLITNNFKSYDINDFYDLIYDLKNPLLKIYLVLIINDVFSEDLKNVKPNKLNSSINDLSYSNVIIGISEIYSEKNNNYSIKSFIEKHKEEFSHFTIYEIDNNTSTTSESLIENINNFYSNYYEDNVSSCINEGLDLLKYFNLIKDHDSFSHFLDILLVKIMTENTLDSAIIDSFNNIISLNIEKNNFSEKNNLFVKKFIEYVKLNNIEVNSISLYSWISKFSSIKFTKYFVENNLIISGNDENILIEEILNYVEKESKEDLFNFLYTINCRHDFRKKLLEKILSSNVFPIFNADQLYALMKKNQDLGPKFIEYAFFNKITIADLLLKNTYINKSYDYEDSNLIKILPDSIKKSSNYNIILKCIDDNKLLKNDRKSLAILSKKLSGLNLHEEALHIANIISDDDFAFYKYDDGSSTVEVNYENSMKSLVLKSISINLLNSGLVDESIKVANKIYDLNIRFKLYNELRDILKSNLNSFDLKYEVEIFKLYENQSNISKWSMHWWESVENAFSSEIDSIFNSLVKEFNLSKDKSIINDRLSNFLDKYLETNFDTCSLNTVFLVDVINFLSKSHFQNGNTNVLKSYTKKIIKKTEKYVQIIIDGYEGPTKNDNDMLYVGNILSSICLNLNDKDFLKLKKNFVKKLIDLVENPIIYESDNINWNSYYQNEPYSEKIKEQGDWLKYASLSFDLFKILNQINDSRGIDFLEKSLLYIIESEKQFLKNNKIVDISKAFSDLKWYSNIPLLGERSKWHHTARPNQLTINILEYFSKKNDIKNFNKFLEIYLSPNSQNDSDKDFKYVNYKNIKFSNNIGNYKIHSFNNYNKLKVEKQNNLLHNSSGEINSIDMFNQEDQSVFKNGLFCDDVFGSYSFLTEEINDSDEFKYGHILLHKQLIDFSVFDRSFICDLIGLNLPDRIVQLSKLLSHKLYIVVQAQNIKNESGQSLKQLDFLNEDEYFNILESLPPENIYLDDSDLEKFIAKSGSDAIYVLIKNIFTTDHIFEYDTKKYDFSEFINLLFIKVLPVLHPKLRPVIKLENGKYALSDLNELYRKLIKINNRLKRLIDIKAPEVILKKVNKLLQDSFDDLQNQFLKYENEINKIYSNKLISFYIYMLSELKDFSDIYIHYLSLAINHTKKLHDKPQKISKISLDILRTLLISLNYSAKNNELDKVDNINKYISLLRLNLSDHDFKSFCLDQFIYMTNEDAISFYNSNYIDDKTAFSNNLNSLIEDGRINIENYFPILNTFNDNIMILKKYTKSISSKNIL